MPPGDPGRQHRRPGPVGGARPRALRDAGSRARGRRVGPRGGLGPREPGCRRRCLEPHSRARDGAVSSLAGTAADAGALSTVGEDAARRGGHDLIVNCTAIGLDAADDPFTALPIDRDRLGDSIVLDLVYGSGGDTQLIHAARAAGSEVIDGLEVLVRQGAESLRIWTGREPDLEVMRLAARGS